MRKTGKGSGLTFECRPYAVFAPVPSRVVGFSDVFDAIHDLFLVLSA